MATKHPTRPPHPYDVLTTSDLARWLQVSPRTVERRGFHAVSPGRYLFQHILDQLEEDRRKARKKAA
jgi:hypothetical protein